jgi:hypothetical protein
MTPGAKPFHKEIQIMATSLEVLNITNATGTELGRGAAASGANSVAIGAAIGDPTAGTFTNGAFATAAGAIAIGTGAKATAAGAVQIGAGTNAAANTIQFQTTHLVTDTAYNALRAYMGTGLKASAGLALSATATRYKTTLTAIYSIGGPFYSKVATDHSDLEFSAAHVVSATKFGVILVQITAAGVLSTKVPSATQAYNTAALALAALPAADALNVALGYIAIAADAGDWTANTDDMTDGSDLTTATFVNATPDALPAAI